MEIFILNKKLELIGILENFIYFSWNRKFYEPGEFELHCKPNSNITNLLKEDNIIFRKNDEEAAFIETLQMTIENGEEIFVVKGKFLTAYLNRRINWGRIQFTGAVEDLMRKLVYDNAINPTNLYRKIPSLKLGNYKNFSTLVNYQNSFGNILEELRNLGNTYEIGYNISLDFDSKELKFNLKKGVDRTCNQENIAPCVFSREFENILTQDNFKTNSNYKNTCLIAGAGEGDKRKITSIEKEKGLERYEFFVDARDLIDKDKNEVEIDLDKYKEILKNRGEQKLSLYKKINSFNAQINSKGNNKYKIDFDLGDFVTVLDTKWNIQINTQITEIEEVFFEGKFEINPVFGRSIASISNYLNLRRF